MNNDLNNSVAAEWTRLGAMFNVAPASDTPDVEGLLLDTVRAAPGNSRLFVLAATWLSMHAEFVADLRLAQLIRNELESEHRPTLGFLLEWAAQRSSSGAQLFEHSIDACGGAIDQRPLLDVERSNPKLAQLAEQRASELSRKWGRWMEEFEPKDRAIRPDAWIFQHNPELLERAKSVAR